MVYASPSGTGTACSSAAPCSLTQAQTNARAQVSGGTDISVVLADGTYSLSSTLAITSADSVSGHTVTYQAAPGAAPVLSGGSAITGWSQVSGSMQWVANAPAADTRQIYVNGRRAVVDSRDAAAVFTGLAHTSTGYSYTSSTLSSPNVSTADVVFAPGNYEYGMCPASSIGSNAITVQTECWAALGSISGQGIPTAVENAKDLLGTPGQFFIDRSVTPAQIYYVPRAGENLTTATVVAPQLQTLVSLTGATGIAFTGISFEYGTWSFGNTGVVDGQGNKLQLSSDTSNVALIPANVVCHTCTGVTFRGDTFTHLGAGGLSVDGSGSGVTVTGNVFTDISSNGIQIGVPQPIASPPLESNDTITDNAVSYVSNEYLGGDGIWIGNTVNTTIDHNEVSNVPYTGITLGVDNYQHGQGGNHIDDNYVHDVMLGDLSDGGAIYVAGVQSTTSGSTIEGNNLGNQSALYAPLYFDSNASNWTVENNVLSGAAPYWLLLQSLSYGPAINNTVINNYVSSQVGGPWDLGQSGANTTSPNQTGLTSWPVAAQTIMSAAGLEPAYLGLRSVSGPVNLAVRKPATAHTQWNSDYAASKGDDGYNGSVYAAAGGDTAPYWQVDLGAEHPLTELQILARTDGEQGVALTNLKIEVSDTSSLTSGFTVACTTDATPLPLGTLFRCPLPSGEWRYVSIVKTDSGSSTLAFSQARVFGYSDDRSPAATITPGGLVSLSMRGNNGGTDAGLYLKTATGGTWPGTWTSLGGQFIGDPSVVSLIDGGSEVFGRGTDNQLWTRAYDSSGTPSTPWTGLSGVLADSPGAAVLTTGQITVFVQGTNGGLYSKTQPSKNGAWPGSWTSQGGPNSGLFTGNPSVIPLASGSSEVFVRGTDNHLWTITYNASGTPGTWTDLSGVLAASPGAAFLDNGYATVYTQGTDGGLDSKTQTSSGWPGSWTTLGGPTGGQILGSPSVVPLTGGAAQVFVRGTDDQVYTNTFSASGVGTGWTAVTTVHP